MHSSFYNGADNNQWRCYVPFPLHESFHNWTTIMTYFFEMIKWQPVAAEISEKIFSKIVPFWY